MFKRSRGMDLLMLILLYLVGVLNGMIIMALR